MHKETLADRIEPWIVPAIFVGGGILVNAAIIWFGLYRSIWFWLLP